jgi:hypothetical protein
MISTLELVYRDRRNVVLATCAGASMVILMLWSGNILTVRAGTAHLSPDQRYFATSILIGALFGLVLPVQLTAIRMAVKPIAETGGTMLATLAGAASATCCAPVVFPSLLSLLGFSGTTILNVDGTLHRFWFPLAVASLCLLGISLLSVSQSLERTCLLPERRRGHDRSEPGDRAGS